MKPALFVPSSQLPLHTLPQMDIRAPVEVVMEVAHVDMQTAHNLLDAVEGDVDAAIALILHEEEQQVTCPLGRMHARSPQL